MLLNFIIIIIFALMLFRTAPVKPISDFNQETLSPAASSSLKGILCVLIVLCHESTLVHDSLVLKPFLYFGFLGVAGFFFLSGYGIFISYGNKENYLEGFAKRRFIKVFFPWFAAFLIYAAYAAINKNPYKLGQLIINVKTGNTFMSNAWYVVAIAVFYIAFYLCAKCIKSKTAVLLALSAIITAAAFALALAGYDKYWYSSLSALIVGMLWGLKRERLLEYFKSKWLLKTILTGGIFAVCLFVHLSLKHFLPEGNYLEYIKAFFNEIAGAAFAFLIPLLSMKARNTNRLTDWLGKLSYEIYLMHGLFILIFTRSIIIENSALLTVSVLGCTIAAAAAIHYGLAPIMNKTKKEKRHR